MASKANRPTIESIKNTARDQSEMLSPPANSSLSAVFLSKPTNHPNVFRKRIKRIEGKPQAGDWVAVYHEDTTCSSPQLFAYGLYNPKSEVAVRIMRFDERLPDEQFWAAVLDRAIALRRDVLRLDEVTDCYRVIHAEADGLPGMVVDRYGDCLSAEVFSLAMSHRAEAILERLSTRLGTLHWLIQPSPQFTSQEGFSVQSRSSQHLPSQVTVKENGTQFRVHFGSGHKTGFFCDQRDNRLQLAKLCRGQSVLDVCCYTGGFAIQAAKLGQACEVTGIDLDQEPLEIAKRNATLNGIKAKFVQAEAFSYMRDMLRSGKRFDIVVLDPPKLIRNRAELEDGTKKHFDLNRLAMQIVRPGGLMLTCSCAGLLPETEFIQLVRAAARSVQLIPAAERGLEQSSDSHSSFSAALRSSPALRAIQILARTGAAPCHPVATNCPETEYLKAIWLRL